MIEFAPGNLRVPRWTRPVYMVAAGRVKACFRTGAEATHTCLDLYWEPA